MYDERTENNSVFEDVCAPVFKQTHLLSKSACEKAFKTLTDALHLEARLLPKEECEALFDDLTEGLFKSLTKRKKTNPSQELNETSRFLFDGKASRWTEWQESLVSYTLRKGLAGHYKDKYTAKEEATDMVLSFLAWVCKEDKLAGRTHEQVMFHWVQSTMYVQWVTRLREKRGQDALSRHRSKKNRTQQERKVGEFAISDADSCSEVLKKDEETGAVSSTDLWNPTERNEVEEELHEESLHRLVGEVLESNARSEKEAELWKRAWKVIYAQKDPSTKMYDTDQSWADAWGMPVAKVRRLKEKVRTILASSEEMKSL